MINPLGILIGLACFGAGACVTWLVMQLRENRQNKKPHPAPRIEDVYLDGAPDWDRDVERMPALTAPYARR